MNRMRSRASLPVRACRAGPLLPFLGPVTPPEPLRNPTVKDEAAASGITQIQAYVATHPRRPAWPGCIGDVAFCAPPRRPCLRRRARLPLGQSSRSLSAAGRLPSGRVLRRDIPLTGNQGAEDGRFAAAPVRRNRLCVCSWPALRPSARAPLTAISAFPDRPGASAFVPPPRRS